MRVFEIIIIIAVSIGALWVIFNNIRKMYRGEGCSSCSANCKYRSQCKVR